ncbi:MAG: SGNH/GDSL hydrolase family protein [Eubacteriales bacterium]
MKEVLLLGDSIAYGGTTTPGYGVYVRERLAGLCRVHQPAENCRFAQYTQRYLHEWAQAMGAGRAVRVVHWNNGLWDVLRLQGDEPFTSLAMYGEVLERIHGRIRRLFPDAQVIFALSTPVIESRSHPDFTRRNSDIQAYNQAAAELMERLGVQVNDLYTTASAFPADYYTDWVHFGEAGSRALADAVTRQVVSCL